MKNSIINIYTIYHEMDESINTHIQSMCKRSGGIRMKMKKIAQVSVRILFIFLCSCGDYLDVVPDNVATIDNAFSLRNEAEKYLFTCYSYMPKDGNLSYDPAMEGGDEIWRILSRGGDLFNIARGYQNITSPYGDSHWSSLYKGFRDCNIFLENIEKVPDMVETEKKQWIAEVKFLKVYYHFYLVRMFGPIPLIKTNLPIDASVDEVKVFRDPVDSCFNYMVKLIDEAVDDLPLNTVDIQNEAGRINKVVAKSFKAKILVTAASPLFNGNTDQVGLKNSDGTALFNPTYSKAKWDSAVVACREAIETCEEAALKLYEFGSNYQQYVLSDAIRTQLSIRNSVCEKWNSEIIWANTQSYCSVQAIAFPVIDPDHTYNYAVRGELSPPLKIAEMFYSRHGVPIDEDKTWDYNQRYSLRVASDNEKLYVRKGYTTASLNFDREPRFYASLGFDGGIWYGHGNYDDTQHLNLFYVKAKYRQINALKTDANSITGYFLKKLVNFQNVMGDGTIYSITGYPFPIMRLSDLYLLYAEALNESEGPGNEVYKYLNLVRARAGLPTVESAWTNYSTNPEKYKTQNGLREIIHQERLIELAFECQRFWDLRRWKEATKVLNAPIKGWDGTQETEANYYRPVVIFNQKFGIKDYFWPIRDARILNNRNLVQNTGW